MSARTITRFGMLTAVALVLGYIERFIPVAQGIPGIKMGLGNTVLLYALYLMDAKSAWLLMVLKVLLSGFIYAGVSGMLYSFGGGVLSLIVMLLIKKIPGTSVVAVSVTGAVGHNIGQIAVACAVLGSFAALSYLPVLMISGLATGILTGLVAKYVFAALQAGGAR